MVVFHVPLENFLNSTIVTHFLTFCQSTVVNNYVFSIIALGIIIYFVIHRRAIIANSTILFLFSLSAIYLYYRCNETVWVFTPFYNFPNFKYFDILVLVSALSILNWATRIGKTKEVKRKHNSFFDDEPLNREKPDELGRVDIH